MTSGRYVVLDAYLITEANSQLTTFQVYNELNQLIENAQLTFFKTINGNLVRVAQRTTDFTGAVQINLDNNALYVLRVTHDNYLQKEVSLIPTSTNYIVKLTGTSLDYTSVFDNIDYYIAPSGVRNLDGETNYSFMLSISSSNNDLDSWGVFLTYYNDSGGVEYFIDNHTGASSGGIAYLNITTPINYTMINATFFFQTATDPYWEKIVRYYVYPAPSYNYSVVDVFDEYGGSITDLEKVLIATFCTLALVGVTALKLTFNPLLLAVETLIVYGFFAYLGFVPLWLYLLILVPTIVIYFLSRGGEG